MIVVCEQCGKKYRLDADKIGDGGARFKCKSCNHTIMVAKPAAPAAAVADEVSAPPSEPPPAEPPPPEPAPQSPSVPLDTVAIMGGRRRLGLRTKMILLFFLVPNVILIAAGFLYITQLDHITGLITQESTALINQFVEQMLAEKSRSVASEVRLYLQGHPQLAKEDFNYEMDFKRVSVQKIGQTGYTALYERPGSDGVWRTWSHANPKIVGIDMTELKKSLGDTFDAFWKIYIGVKDGRESSGYYKWRDTDGQVREKFMVCTPVEGTPYVVATTTYVDEFARHANRLKARAERIHDQTRTIVLAILGGSLVLIGLIVSIYGHIVTGRIKTLTDLATRISVGDLEAKADIRATDEIGDLAQAIGRMQTSIRLSLERFRKRR